MPAAPPRSKTRLLLTTLAGAVVGTAFGWLLRGDVSQGSVTSQTGSASTVLAEAQPGPTDNKPSAPAATENVAGENSLLPLLRLLCAADTAAPRDMPRLLLTARATPGVVPFLAQHWAELSAPHMFGVLRTETGARPLSRDATVTKALFDAWLAHDKNAALTALDDDEALPDMERLRSSVVRELLVSEPRRALEKIAQWRLNLHYNDMGGIAEWAKRDPVAAAEASAKVPLHGVSEHLLIEIAKVWGRTDPVAAMQWCLQHPSRAAVAAISHNVRMVWEDTAPAAMEAFTATITDPALRLKLDLPPLPRGESRTATVLPGE